VRDAHAVRQRAGAGDRLRRAAALLAVGARVGPQLERHGQHVVSGIQGELRGGRAVHPAAHRHEGAARTAPQGRGPVARGQAECAVERVGRQRGGVHRGRRETAQLPGDRLRRDRPCVTHRRAGDERDGSAACTARGGASLRVEPGLRDPIALHADRDSNQISADRAPGRAGVRRARQLSASMRIGEVVVQGASGHDWQRSRVEGPSLPLSTPGLGLLLQAWVSSGDRLTAKRLANPEPDSHPVDVGSTWWRRWRTSSSLS
jgi:hypothetical protein